GRPGRSDSVSCSLQKKKKTSGQRPAGLPWRRQAGPSATVRKVRRVNCHEMYQNSAVRRGPIVADLSKFADRCRARSKTWIVAIAPERRAPCRPRAFDVTPSTGVAAYTRGRIFRGPGHFRKES